VYTDGFTPSPWLRREANAVRLGYRETRKAFEHLGLL
jgi:hypothetical protein